MKASILLSAIVVIACGTLAATSARADIRPPGPQPKHGKPSVPLEVTFDGTRELSVLKIGREALKQATGVPANRQSQWSPAEFRSIVAAVAMSLGVAGVFLLRGRRGLATGVALVAGALVATAAVQAWGNVPPPFEVPIPFRMGGDGGYHGRVVIEIVDDPAAEASLVVGTKLTAERVPAPNQPPG